MSVVSIYPSIQEKEQLFLLMDKYDTLKEFSSLTESLSNFIKGKVTIQNLKDMFFALSLIEDSDSNVLRPILEERIFEISK